MDKWSELRTAYHVAKLGTVSAAAETLGFDRATVKRHIEILEAEIGARVFIRHASGYALTELGEDLLQVAQKTSALIEDLEGRAKGARSQVEGEIRISVPPILSATVTDAISRFRVENPGCRVNLEAERDLARLEHGEAQIAVRAGNKPDHPDYVVLPFRTLRLNLYAHDRYVARHGLPKNIDDLAMHEFVMPRGEDAQFPFWPWAVENIDAAQIVVTTMSADAGIESVLAGLGIGFLSDLHVRGRSDVKRVLPQTDAIEIPLWLVTHVDLHRTQKIQSMIGFLRMEYDSLIVERPS